MVFLYSIWKDCPDTGRSKGSYIVFYQGEIFYHCTHVPGPVSKSSAESEYNAACNSRIVLAYSRIIKNELISKYPDVVS